MALWVTTGFRIEKRSIPTTFSSSEDVYFLDAEQVRYEDRYRSDVPKSLKTITSGELSHCLQCRNARLDSVRFRNIAERELRNWTLPIDDFYVTAHPVRGAEGNIYATYLDVDHKSSLDRVDIPTCGFNAQIQGPVCYLLTIRLWDEFHHKGHGANLYERVVEIARACGCKVVIQFPAGRTDRGETRASYLARRGWLPGGQEVYMDIEPGYGAKHFKLDKSEPRESEGK